MGEEVKDTTGVSTGTEITTASTTPEAAPAISETKENVETTKTDVASAVRTTKDLRDSVAKAGKGKDEIVPPAFSPNYKFRVDQKEHEIPEWARQAIKDEDSQKMVHEIFCKAYGLDVAKTRHQKAQEKYTELDSKHTALTKSLEQLSDYLNNGDLDSFFETIKLPETEVLKWALNVVNRDKLSPEERQAYDRSREERRELSLMKAQNQELLQQHEQTLVRSRTMELESVLARPEVQTVASSFDTRIGRPGAFRDEVIKRATATYHLTGEDISAERAVSEAIQIFGTALGNAGASVPQSPSNGKPPVIPNVTGRASSPSKKIPMSIADLKEIRAKMVS